MKSLMKNRFLCLLMSVLPLCVWAQETPSEQDQFSTTFRGNQELPQIQYIVPWATPPGPGQVDPLVPHSGNVFQRTFAPIERLETQRRLRYYAQEYETQ